MSFEEYLAEHHTSGTAKRYLKEAKSFFSSVEQPEESSYQDIMDYLGRLREQNQKTINVSLAAIKKYYSYLLATKQRTDHPAKAIILKDKRSRDVQLQDLFKPEELESLLERTERYPLLKNRNKVILSLLIYQGLTSGELKTLELKDINLETGRLLIKSTTRTNQRTLKLRSNQVFWIMNYLHVDRPKLVKVKSEKLLISKRGTEENGEGIGYLLETYRHLFPTRNLNAKTIRQSVITNLLKQGKDLRVVQAFAGHKYPSTTEKYRQTNIEELKNEVLKYHPLDK